MSTKKERMYQRITEHGENLKKIFDLPEDTDPVKLCKMLMKIERIAHMATTNICNTNNLEGMEPHYIGKTLIQQETPIEEQDDFFEKIMVKIRKILGEKNIIFINHDPRGYALKIYPSCLSTSDRIYKDFGGNGIIAPDFREGN